MGIRIPTKKRKNEIIFATDWNDLVAAVRYLLGRIGSAYVPNPSEGHDSGASVGGGGGGVEIQAAQFQNFLTSPNDTYLALTKNTTYVSVAMPFTIRQAAPASNSRTVAGELQLLLPEYVDLTTEVVIAKIGDAAVVDGGTGLTGVEWIELGHRVWVEYLIP